MARGPRKFSTRQFINDALLKKKFEPISELINIYQKTDDMRLQVQIIEIFAERLYPKARPVDADEITDDSSVTVNAQNIDMNELVKAIKKARND